MTEKNIKSRIIHKHDIASNWAKATNFIPLQGEIIVYDIDDDYNYERFKIGDGETNVNSLPFAFSKNYNDLINTPTIPTVNNGTLTIQKNGTTVKTFTANSSSNVTANITVPTKVSELTNDSGYLTSETSLSKGTDTTATKTLSHGGTFTAVTDTAVSGHKITDTTTTYTLPSETTLSKGTTSGSGNAVTDISVSGHTVTLTKGSTFLTAHPTISTSTDSTSTASPSHGGTFTAIDSITRDSNGHVTKVNTKTVTLPSDNNTDTKVTQTSSSTNGNYPLLLAYSTSPTSGTASTTYYDTGMTANPSTNTITATTFSGALSGNATTATTATKLGSSTVGSATQPVYLNAGTATACTYTLGKSVPSDAVFTDTTYSAAGSSLGLVKSGGDVTISSGVITVNDDSHNHTIANVDGLQAALDGKQPSGNYLTSETSLSKGTDATASKTLSFGGTFTAVTDTAVSGHEITDTTTTFTMPSDRLFTTLVPTGTAIGSNVDLNTITYLKVGRYYCSANKTVATLTNCPSSDAFMMEVYSPLSTTIDNESTKTWTYRLRKLTTYTGTEYIQYCYAGATAGTWTYGAWCKCYQDKHFATSASLTSGTKIGTITIDGDTTTFYAPNSIATTSANGLMSASDKSKLDGIASGANAYTLPAATSSTLGGIKVSLSGTTLTITTT